MARDGKYMDKKWEIKFPKIYKGKIQMADVGDMEILLIKNMLFIILLLSN